MKEEFKKNADVQAPEADTETRNTALINELLAVKIKYPGSVVALG